MKAGNGSGIQRRKMAECENNLVGADAPSIRKIDLISVIAGLLPNSDCFAMDLLQRRSAVSFRLLPQGKFQVVAIKPS